MDGGHLLRPPGRSPRRLRDRILANPGFQRWAARFPLTRPVARRRARALFDVCAGFVYAQILFACVELRLFEILADGWQTEAVLADRLGLAPAAARRLLDAAASLHLVQRGRGRRAGAYALGRLGAAALGNPAVAPMVAHHTLFYADLADPVALLRGEAGATRLAAYWPYAAAGDPRALPVEVTRRYTALMAASQPAVAAEALDAYDFGRHRRLLDVGGGNGAFLRAVGARAPRLELHLFDLPSVVAEAPGLFAAAGMAGRAVVHGGSFLSDPLPRGADIATLVRVLHDHDDARAIAILRAVRAALPPAGTLLLVEPMAGAPGAEPVGEAYFGFYLLAMGSGRARSPAEIAALLQHAGFGGPRFLATHTPLITGIAVAQCRDNAHVNVP